MILRCLAVFLLTRGAQAEAISFDLSGITKWNLVCSNGVAISEDAAFAGEFALAPGTDCTLKFNVPENATRKEPFNASLSFSAIVPALSGAVNQAGVVSALLPTDVLPLQLTRGEQAEDEPQASPPGFSAHPQVDGGVHRRRTDSGSMVHVTP